MELNNSFFSDDEEDQCEKVGQANASKKWLNSTFASLAQLEQVKPNVYNVGLVDPRELKGNNLTSNNKRSQSFTDLTTNPPLSTLISQKTAWGSNGSIPDLVKQVGQIDGRPHRPESAKTSARRYRPPSGKKQRPESAKEGSLPPRPPKISVKGAKVDTVGRPAKHTPYQSVTTGWAGPPAGMKYPETPSEQGVTSVTHSVPGTPPPPPQGTPVPHLNIDVEIPNEDEGDSDDDSMVKLKYTKTKTEAPHPVELLRRPTPESLHLNLDIPTMDEEEIEEDSDLDTERLLEKAEKYSTSKKPDDDDFINQVTKANESGDFEESHDKPVEPTIPEEDEDTFSFHSRIESSSDSDGDWTDEEAPIKPTDNYSKKSSEESKPAEKFAVKFIEERNVTIDITPRNAGHKVGSLSPTKQEGQRSGEGQRSKGKGVVSVEEEQKLKAALSVKSAGSKPMVGFVDYSEENGQSYVPQITVTKKGQRPSSAVTKKTEQDRPKVRQRPSSATAVRPSSKPVGRSLQKPITQIIVDYGEEERKRKILRKKLREKDVVTMVEQISASEDEASEESDEDVEITPDLLRPGSPTKCTSEPTKNYYEISRQSAIGRSSVVDKMFEKLKEGASGQPTTMLSDPGESDSKESAAVKSVLDSQLLRINEKQMVTHQVDINREKAKTIRPPSAKVQHKPPIARTDDHERPGSRLGFVAMAPEKDSDHTGNRKVTRRPMSAQSKQAKAPSSDEKKDNSDLIEGTETTATQQENISSSEVPGLTDRQLEIQRLMKKHLTRPLSSNSNNLPSPKSPKSPKCKLPKSPSTVISSARADSKMSSSRSESKVASPRSQKERAIDNMIEKHLKRPASAFTPDIMSESFGDSSPEPPSSPVPVTTEIESTPPTLTLPTTKPTKGRIHRAASLPSPKSTLVSELTAAERSGAGVSCNHGCAHGHGHAETPGLSAKTNAKSSFYTRAKSAPVKRKTAAPKIRYTKPLYLNTVNHSDYPETEEAQECTVMQAKLAAKGVNISAKTLERALYPPSGQTTYYEIKASLPKSQSLGLLSHPKVWLPEEYKQLRSAEKALDKVNEIMYMQKKAEERKAKIADGTAVKKKKKKGKKRPTSSLKRSKSFT